MNKFISNATELTRFSQATPDGGWRVATYVGLLLLGVWIGATIGAPRAAEAEITKGKEPKAFLSGGARSEQVLREIVVIIERMDKRIANIETAINKTIQNDIGR